MQILISNSEVAVIVANWSALNAAGMEFDKKIAASQNKTLFEKRIKDSKDFDIKFLEFISTQGKEIKRGPVTITKVEKGIGITVEPKYVSEFMEIYLTSIIPMLNPMYDLVVASKAMADKLNALDKKFALASGK